MKRRILAIMILCAVVLTGLSLTGCDREPEVTTTASREEKLDAFEIETAYGTLLFPEQWKESLNIQKHNTEQGEEIVFSETVTEQAHTLFTICFAEAEGASKIGDLTGPDGSTHPVYLRINELQFDEQTPDEVKSRIYAMQESINYLIDHMK